MKILSDNIRLLLLLVLLGTGIISCSEDMEDVTQADVTFTATIQDETFTRAFGDGLKVNTLVVGIFDEGMTEIDRKTFPITTTSVSIPLALAKEQTYNFVFWAYNSGCEVYDMANLTAIRMRNDITNTTFAQAENSDAFFATVKNLTVTENDIKKVTLVRPLAQINVGTSGTATAATFTVKNTADTFHPFTETVSGDADFTWTFAETTTETFPVKMDETLYTYNYLALGYLFAPLGKAEAMQKACRLILTDTDETKEFPAVELHARHRSNIVGSFTE